MKAVFHLSYLDVAQVFFVLSRGVRSTAGWRLAYVQPWRSHDWVRDAWHDVGRKYLRQLVRCELDRGQVVLLTRLSFGRRKVHLDPTFLGWRPNTVGFVHEY